MANLFLDRGIWRGSVLLHRGCVEGGFVIWFLLRDGVSKGVRKIHIS